MHSDIQRPLTVLEFAKLVKTTNVTVYSLISKGVIKVKQEGSRFTIDPVTQKKRFYYYKGIQGTTQGAKITNDVLKEIDRLEAENSPYGLTTPEELKREEQQQEMPMQSVRRASTIKGKHKKTMSDADIEQNPELAYDTMARSKMRKEAAMARKAELECAEREGKVIPKEDVEQLWKEVGINLQKSILSIPDRLAPVIAGEHDAHKVHRMLTDELKYTLRNLSNELKSIGIEEEEEVDA